MALAPRIIVVSPLAAIRQELATTLRNVAPVDVFASLESLAAGEVPPALCVIHLDGDPGARSDLLSRLAGSTLIVISPRADLAAVVALMQASDRVAALMVMEELDHARLSAIAGRVLADDLFGLDKTLAPGTEIHSHVIGDYTDKSKCMAQVSSFLERIEVPRRYLGPIEQCIDEMVMNALYDAAVGEGGNHIFAGIPTTTRMTLRTEQSVLVQYAYDGKRFAVSVRDAFGSLQRETVLSYLHKCLHDQKVIDRKAGGAGLGLYLIVNSSTSVYFHLLPGIATEVVCTFDLQAPRLQLEDFGVFVQSDARGQLATPPARVLPGAALRRRRILTAAGVMLAAAIVVSGVLAWPHVFPPAEKTQLIITAIPKGAQIEVDGTPAKPTSDGAFAVGNLEIGRLYAVVARLDGHEGKRAVVQAHAGANKVTVELQKLATVELDSQPPGAVVEIDGKQMGTTPLTLTSLVPGSEVSVAFARSGYRATTTRLKVPPRGNANRLVQPLERSADLVAVRFESTPPGAAIHRSDQPAGVDRTYTPAELFVEADQIQRFTLTMPRHLPLVIEPFTPARGADALVKGGALVKGTTLRIEAAREGKVSIAGAPHCQELIVPADCALAPGRYVAELVGRDNTKVKRDVVVGAEATKLRFEP